MGLSPAAFSERIRRLEEGLGTSLLERSDLRRRLGREGVLPGDVLDRLNRE